MEMPRDRLVLQTEYGLDETRDARRCLKMADVGLHRPECATLSGGSWLPDDRLQSLKLDRVAQRSACSMSLNERDLRRCHTRVVEGSSNDCLLSVAVGCREPSAPAIMIGRRAVDHRENVVIVGKRITEPLERDHAASFTAREAVRASVERLAAPIRR